MELYCHPMSGCSRRVLAFAGAHAIPLVVRHVDLMRGAQRAEEYLALNPTGRVPTLVDGDLVLWESAAILSYLAELHAPEARGSSAPERARIAQWVSWGISNANDAMRALNFATGIKRMRGEPIDEREVARLSEALETELSALDDALEGREWLCGDRPTIADFAIAPSLVASSRLSGFATRHERVARWLERAQALEGWEGPASVQSDG